ncbi:agmatinase [Cellulomonas chengniuliangii]|uniref:Agmatinase n=1 Tax=Cellulomonas chengniuliangii TaxID=2968084 RepID=A0ABY5KYT9_9CELL|nr:agmatinase [Cellulomonas chengniuliangii]MCC2309441.1 agmatinase [Cellulomonas chengniuliangii]UUI74998.1 agmatinase [Cellulomonas chengniuliangii]
MSSEHAETTDPSAGHASDGPDTPSAASPQGHEGHDAHDHAHEGDSHDAHAHDGEGEGHAHSHDLWPEGFWEQPRRLGEGLEGHGAVDDHNGGRAPGLFHVNRKHGGSHSGIRTFAKLPMALTPEDLVAAKVDVAVLGVPWDSTAGGRSGTNHGPLALRTIPHFGSYGFPSQHLDVRVNPFDVLTMCDYGDAPIHVGNTPGTFESIRKFVGTVVTSGAIPIIMGGDHAITWPAATAVADHYGHGKVGIVHFDAHADVGEDMNGALASHGTPMRKLIDSGAVPGRNFVQVGLRGYWPDRETLDWMDEHQMRTHFMAEIDRDGFDKVLERAVDEALDQADHLYISLDIDVCDPAFAPGTGTPVAGGITSIDILRAVRRLSAEVGIVAMDVVEVAPPYDNNGEITVLLANRAIGEAMTGIAMRRMGITGPDYLHPHALNLDADGAQRTQVFRTPEH